MDNFKGKWIVSSWNFSTPREKDGKKGEKTQKDKKEGAIKKGKK